MNKEKAEVEMKKRIENAAMKFCPIIRGMCRRDCVCYLEPSTSYVNVNDPNSGYVGGGYCQAHILMGGE